MKIVDFWNGWESDNHWFLQKMKKKSEGSLYSVHGSNPETENGAYHLSKPRIFFTAEPDHKNPHKERLKSADYSFSYHYGDGTSNSDLKSYFSQNHVRILNFVAKLGPEKVKREIRNYNENSGKTVGRGVCMVYSRKTDIRRKLFYNLDFDVNSAGRVFNTEEGWTVSKDRWKLIDYISQYKFYLAIENSRHTGYVTEKLYNALLSDAIPVYWGAPDVGRVFNSDAFINLDNFSSIKGLSERLKNMSDSECQEILDKPIANPNHEMFNVERINKIIEKI